MRLLIRGPSGRQRFNVLGAIDAITHEVTTVVNDTVIDALAVCELLRKLSDRYAGLPLTLVLDNARYQKCQVVRQLAAGPTNLTKDPAERAIPALTRGLWVIESGVNHLGDDKGADPEAT